MVDYKRKEKKLNSRITVSITRKQKESIEKRSKELGITQCEIFRREGVPGYRG